MPKKRFSAQYSKPQSTVHPSLSSSAAQEQSSSSLVGSLPLAPRCCPLPPSTLKLTILRLCRQRCFTLRKRTDIVATKQSNITKSTARTHYHSADFASPDSRPPLTPGNTSTSTSGKGSQIFRQEWKPYTWACSSKELAGGVEACPARGKGADE